MPAKLSIPTVPITDDPKFSICLNEDWIPILVGQLKLLTQDFMWDSSDPSVLFDTEAQIAELLSEWSEDCFATPYPRSHWRVGVSGESVLVATNLRLEAFIPEGDKLWGNTTMLHFRNAAEPIEVMFPIISFFDPLDSTSVGVKVTDFKFAADLDSDLIECMTIDCLNEFQVFDGAGHVSFSDLYPDTPYKALKQIQVLCYTSSIAGFVCGYDDPVCIEA